VAAGDLLPAAAEVIFADTESEILGPLPTALGPAIFRVNGVLDATEVSFEEASEELRAELASEAARRVIDDLRDPADDLLAGGATLEELAETTEMELGTIDFTPVSEAGIAGYDAFREAALAAAERDFPELLELSDGGLFALRLDEVVPPALPPLAGIRDEVAEAWRATALREALAAYGQEVVTGLATDRSLEDFGGLTTERQVRRQDFIPDAPPTLVAQVYQLAAPGDVVLVPGAEVAVIARLDSINPAARDDPSVQILTQIFAQTVAQSMAQDIFEIYGQAVQAEAGIRLDQAMINAVHANFP
jgi:peptidyl-prolyl cis-trans isomerase D